MKKTSFCLAVALLVQFSSISARAQSPNGCPQNNDVRIAALTQIETDSVSLDTLRKSLEDLNTQLSDVNRFHKYATLGAVGMVPAALLTLILGIPENMNIANDFPFTNGGFFALGVEAVVEMGLIKFDIKEGHIRSTLKQNIAAAKMKIDQAQVKLDEERLALNSCR